MFENTLFPYWVPFLALTFSYLSAVDLNHMLIIYDLIQGGLREAGEPLVRMSSKQNKTQQKK